MTSEAMNYCKQLPKVELHAHLNGSISLQTMATLLERRSKKLSSQGNTKEVPQLSQVAFNKGERKKLDSAFAMFKLIHSVVDDEEAILLASCDVVKEFYEDNVKYLELRTTPRANLESGMTKTTYIKAVLNGIRKGVSELPGDMIVRLLLSVDRRQDISEAYDTLKLAQEYRLLGEDEPGKVVGLDLSGDPKAGNTKEIVTMLNEAKKQGMKLAVHLSERSDREIDTQELLTVEIDRIGHGTFLHRGPLGVDSPNVKHVHDNKIPIEICMTSNIKGQTVESYEQHHFKFWKDRGHPCILCTDDKGLFATSLTEEYHIAAETFGLNREELFQLSKNSVNYIFDSENCKKQLLKYYNPT